MISKTQDKELFCECNECGNTEYGGCLEFKEFVNGLKKDGWKIRRVNGEWEHYCPECPIPVE